jgi:hypothetical protein
MTGAGFHSFAKPRALVYNVVLADRGGVYSAECHIENRHTADCYSQAGYIRQRIATGLN